MSRLHVEDRALRETALAWRGAPYAASVSAAPARPLQIFARMGVMLAVAFAFAMTAQWLIGAPLGNG